MENQLNVVQIIQKLSKIIHFKDYTQDVEHFMFFVIEFPIEFRVVLKQCQESSKSLPGKRLLALIPIEMLNLTAAPIIDFVNDVFSNENDHSQCPKSKNEHHWSFQLLNC